MKLIIRLFLAIAILVSRSGGAMSAIRPPSKRVLRRSSSSDISKLYLTLMIHHGGDMHNGVAYVNILIPLKGECDASD